METFAYFSPVNIRRELLHQGAAPRRRLGQNFLIDRNYAEKIGALIADKMSRAPALYAPAGTNIPILEIGPGLGAITHILLSKNFRVRALEIDPVLCRILSEMFMGQNNLELIQCDALKGFRSQKPGEFPCIVGNIPYYITTDLLLGAMALKPSHIVFLVQADFAQRIVARRSESSLRVFVGNAGVVKEELKLPRSVFYPSPKVGSSLISVQMHADGPRSNPAVLERILRASFMTRRKKMVNSWKKADLPWSLESLMAAAAATGIDPEKRAEEIDAEQFFEMAKWIDKAG